MENDIVEKINDDLSLEELSEITRTALAAIYRKLREDFGYRQSVHCSVVSIGSNEYDVNLIMINDMCHGNGQDYVEIYSI